MATWLLFVYLVITALSLLAATITCIPLSSLLPFCLFCSVSLSSPLAKEPCCFYLQTFPLASTAACNHSSPLSYPVEPKFCLIHTVLLYHSPPRWLLLLNSFFNSHLLHSVGFLFSDGSWYMIFMCGQEEALSMVFKSTGLRRRIMFQILGCQLLNHSKPLFSHL